MNQSTERKGSVTGFHHIALRVKNFDETVHFYRDGLGLKECLTWGDENKRAIMFDAGNNNRIEIFEGSDNATGEGTIIHMALGTSDCDAILKRAEDAGATVTMPAKTVDIPAKTGPVKVRIAFVRTPGGEVIEFFQEMAN